MSYYWFNRQAILQKAKGKYPKEKAAAQLANIGPQDVRRTSPSNVPRTSPNDPI